MKKFIEDTEILLFFSSYLRHKEVGFMTPYCKNVIGFPMIILENPSIYRNKHNEIKREMTSSGETGGAASMHIILCRYKNSLMEIKTNALADKVLIISVKGNSIQMACDFFKGNIKT